MGGFWIHLDVDVLDDSIMPTVDYRLEGGLSFSKLNDLLRTIYSSEGIVGMSITIFNPRLDLDNSIASKFVSSIGDGWLRTSQVASQGKQSVKRLPLWM